MATLQNENARTETGEKSDGSREDTREEVQDPAQSQ